MGMDRFDFSRPVQGIVTQEDIPPTPQHAVSSQSYEMREKAVYNIFDQTRTVYTAYQVEEWVRLGKSENERVIRLRSPLNAVVMHLSNWQIARLEADKRIVPATAVPTVGDGGVIPGYALSITGRRKEKAEWYLLYIDEVLKAHRRYCKGGHSRKIMERAVFDLAERRGEKPPSMTALYEKLARIRHQREFDRLAAVADHPRQGNRSRRKPNRAEEAVSEAIEETLFVKGDWNGVKALLYKWTRLGAKYADLPNLVEKVGDVKPLLPDRTIQRRLAAVDHFTRDSLVYGDEFAEQKYADRITQIRPEHVLDIVDVDHTTLNIFVFGEGVAFGRPDLVLFRDRYSGIILGWAITFGPPSYETFLEGLLNAMSPKEADTLPDGVIYPWYGRPFRLGVDNAKHLVGLNVKEAAAQLGMQTVAYRPGHPWEKGALEHLFRVLDVSLVERLPGSTAMSPAERMKFDDDRMKALPHIDIAELNGFLAYYFANVYSPDPHQGLGHIPSLSKTPTELWSESIANVPPRPLQDSSILVRLAGDTREVGITDHGLIRWGNLEYQSAGANALKLSARRKRGEGKYHGTKFRAVRDPADLGKIWVEIPWEPGRHIEVPISGAYARYATGLKLYQHRLIVAHHRKKSNEAANAPALMAAKADLMQTIVDTHARRRKHGTATKLARFVARQATRIERSKPVVVEEGIVTRRLDVAKPARAQRLTPQSPLASSRMPKPRIPDPRYGDQEAAVITPETVDAHVDEKPEIPKSGPLPPAFNSIDDIAARNEEWED